MSLRKVSLLGLISALLTGLALGSEAIPNWPAPATWSPPRSRGVSTLSETNPLPFQAVTPCRVADTRGNGFTGQYGPPSLAANATRSFTITGVCGIPASAAAVSFNFAALNVGGAGDLRVFPAGGSVPLVSTLNYNGNTPNIANAAVVPLGTGGAITVQADAISIDLIIDVNGYYYGGSASLASGETFTLVGDVAGAGTGVLSVHNTETSFGQVRAGYFLADSSGFGSVAVAAYESAASGLTSGVYGQASSSTAFAAGVIGAETATTGQVYGVSGSSSSSSLNAAGVLGTESAGSGLTSGVYGQASSSTAFSAGVTGAAIATAGQVYGLRGLSSSAWNDSAGVLGVTTSGATASVGFPRAGVRGQSASGYGVLGLTSDGQCCGVAGFIFDSAGTTVAQGYLGYNGAFPYGVYAQAGTIGCTGCTKQFVEPHPANPTKSIHYVSLEGNEAGTYFRGTARTVNGQAVITVPEDFRIVTDPEGLTVQLTPVGGPASMYVEDEDLNQIVVHSSRDVTFHYLVQGIRPDYKNFKPIVDGTDFMPDGPDAIMLAAWPEKVKRALISNGTYNPDGTVNMETAERLGWTKIWADREAQARDAAAHAPMMGERR